MNEFTDITRLVAIPENRNNEIRSIGLNLNGQFMNLLFLIVFVMIFPHFTLAQKGNAVDFRYSPPEWQTAICLPDDPHKSLVDKSGALLYHYRKGGREFGTRIEVEVVKDALWQKQELYSPEIPVVKTYLKTNNLDILEQAFESNTVYLIEIPIVYDAKLKEKA